MTFRAITFLASSVGKQTFRSCSDEPDRRSVGCPTRLVLALMDSRNCSSRQTLRLGAKPKEILMSMRKYSILFVAAALAASTGVAAAQNQPRANKHKQPMTTGQSDPARGTGFTGAPSTTNPQLGGGYQSPREIPENGGAPNTRTNRRSKARRNALTPPVRRAHLWPAKGASLAGQIHEPVRRALEALARGTADFGSFVISLSTRFASWV